MRVTANQVTVARLLALPILPYCLYGDVRMRVIGVIVGTLIGLTDFVDGLLARRYGVTVLGSLLDPVADKVFVVVCFTPFADVGIGVVPWWVVAAVLSRELLVTVLRSSLELQGRRLPSTVIAKTKTWAQMIAFGVLVLIPIVDARGGLPLLLGIPLAVGVAIGVVGRLRGKRWWPIWFAAAAFGVQLAAATLLGAWAATAAVLVIVVGITWVSAADYLAVGLREVARPSARRPLHVLRLVAGAALPVIALAVIGAGRAPIVPVVILLSIEMARGALDNFVANRGIADFSWAASLTVEGVLLLVALVVPGVGTGLSVLAAVVAGLTMVDCLARSARAGIRVV